LLAPSHEHREFRPEQQPTTERRACGQVSGATKGDADQSCARISAPVAPPPAKKSAGVAASLFPDATLADPKFPTAIEISLD
jgi:hypothetical protein